MARSPQTFGRDVERFAMTARQRLEQIPRLAAVAVVADVRVPKTQGGNMPVRYGNLRNSIQGSLNGVPPANVHILVNALVLPDPMVQIMSTIDQATIGDTISLGFTVDYAGEQENKNAFVRLTAQKWSQIVDGVVRQLGAP